MELLYLVPSSSSSSSSSASFSPSPESINCIFVYVESSIIKNTQFKNKNLKIKVHQLPSSFCMLFWLPIPTKYYRKDM